MRRKLIFLMIFLVIFTNFAFAKNNNEKINLTVKDADLKNILLLFAEYTNKNFIVDERVKGKITIRLKDVPWRQALKIILEAKDLKMLEEGNVIRIVTKSYYEKLQQEKLKLKETKKELAPLYTEAIPINFTKADILSKKIKPLLSKRGKVITDARTNILIVTDIKEKLNLVKKLIKILDRPTKQVIIEAKIVIIKDSAKKELGIQWGGSIIDRLKSDKYFYGVSGYTNISTDTGVSGITNLVPKQLEPSNANLNIISVPSEYVVNVPTISPPTGGISLIFGRWGYYNLAVKLSALKSKNLAKEISSPKVIALDNEKAIIAQGEEIPYKTVSDKGTKTEFKEAKLKLEVTPHITSNNMISLDINLSKDSKGELTPDGPAINTQEVHTKLLLNDGETAVIGGIISNTTLKGESSVPFFSDIPVFGRLFKNKIKQNTNGELLIFITPTIVKKKYNLKYNIQEINVK